jgi:hypothetical protein
MSAATYPVDTGHEANASETALPILPGSATVNTPPDRLPKDVPVAIPASQLYYWTGAWQQGEREALEAIKRGDSRDFDDPRDAIRWLLSAED